MRSLVLVALQAEAPDLFQHSWVFDTGVGKVNAAMRTTALIMSHGPQRIINFGTAGGVTVSTGLHRCNRFVQRDMRCEALGYAPGETPFQMPIVIESPGPGVICGTGDSFVTGEDLPMRVDLVDMEAYAIAAVCYHYGVEFECWKYITDQADDTAHVDWKQSIAQGQPHYVQKLIDLGL